jgi:autotransporter-associated beta strand protein
MNRNIYRLIFSRTHNAFVAVPEISRAQGKSSHRPKRRRAGEASSLVRCVLAAAVAVAAFPAIGATCGSYTCDIVLTINADNTVSVDNSAYGTGNGEDPALLVINNSATTVNSIVLGGTPGNGAFYDDFDGLYGGGPNGNTYETSLATFAMSTTDPNLNSGSVLFTNGLATGQSTYFSLESLTGAFQVQSLTSPSIPGLSYSLSSNIDTVHPYYLAAGVPAATLTPVFDGGTLKLDGTALTPYTFTITGNNGTIDLNGQSATISNPIADAAAGTPGGLTISNSGSGGTLTLSGVNTYTGATGIASGATLALTGSGSIATSAGVTDNGSFDISGANGGVSITTLSGNGNVALGANSLSLTNASGTFGGTIAGTGGLVLNGGNEALTGNNTYSGGTTLNGGAQVTAIAPANSVLLTTADVVDGANISVGNAAAALNSGTLSIDAANNLGSGAVAFNGGTLQARASLAAATTMTVDVGNGAVDNGGNAVALSGDITGAGGLTFVGAGTTTLSGANTFAGGATLAGGTVAIGAAANLGAGGLAFNGDGTIDNGGHAATFSGVVSGPGGMSYTGAGTTTLSGANTYAGGSNLLGGTVSIAAPGNLGSGAINFNGGTLLTTSAMMVNAPMTVGPANGTIDNGGNNDTFTGNINGVGALTLTGSGATVITGAANHAGSLLVSPGTMLLMGVSGSRMTVASGSNAGTMQLGSGAELVAASGLSNSGTLYGTGGVLTGSLNNVSGTISVTPTLVTSSAPGIAPVAVSTVAAAPTFADFGQASVSSVSTITGDFTQGVNGMLNFSITPTANTQMQVAGNIQLAGGLAVQASTGHYLRTTYTLINDPNPNATLSGQFSSVAVSGLPQNWGYNITYVTDPQVLLSVFPLTAFASAGNTAVVVSPIANVASAGAALDTAVPTATGTLYQQLNTLYQLPSAQLAAALQQLDGEMYANASGVLSRAVDDSWYPVYSRMGLSAIQPGALPEKTAHVWISGLGSVTHINSDGNANGIRQDLSGFLIGADRNVAGWDLGLTAGSVHAGATHSASGDSRLSATMWQVGGYASTAFGSGMRAGMLLGYTQGPVNFANSSVLGATAASATAQVFSAQTRASWTEQLGAGSSFTPMASLNAVTVHLGQLSESGIGPMGLVVPTQNTSTVNARVQVRFDHTWTARGVEWAASSSFGVQQMLVQPDEHLTVNYAGIDGSGFAVDGIQVDRTAALFGVGLTARLGNRATMDVGYRGTYGSRATENAVQAKLVIEL